MATARGRPAVGVCVCVDVCGCACGVATEARVRIVCVCECVCVWVWSVECGVRFVVGSPARACAQAVCNTRNWSVTLTDSVGDVAT